jgi:citrate lyase gamma subunit
LRKGLYDLPEGIEDMEEGEAMIAIDVMSDDGVEVVLEDGSVEITFGEEIEET